MGSPKFVGIGAAARLLGTTERTLRYYEERGLIPAPEREGTGHRRYGPPDLEVARQVLALRRLGLEVEVVKSLLSGDQGDLQPVLQQQVARLDAEIDDLTRLRDRAQQLANQTPGTQPTRGTIDLLEEIHMRIVLSKIYTRTGDSGTTAIGGGSRVDKADPRLEVIGDVDELVSALGIALAAGPGEHVDLIRALQNELFDLGAELASNDSDAMALRRVTPAHVTRLEEACDRINATLEPPASFVLPGSDATSAALHQARAICRRAERHAWAVPEVAHDVRRYLNRLSDLLFILARATTSGDEPTWESTTADVS
ncbi:MAG TPA: cob(I)yrinic acid a,c-diamide adenosyltransferase [Actinomycetales bacterium]|nr:cob(I)yrinic acid a,c-diamide adenosyltransferase [Actinomycetales bacterium]